MVNALLMELVIATSDVMLPPFNANAPVPFKLPLILATFSVLPVFNVRTLNVMFFAPLSVGVALAATIKFLLPNVVVVAFVTNVPPFKLKTPVPNGFVTLVLNRNW